MKKYILLLPVLLVMFSSKGTAQTFFPEAPRIDVTMAFYKYKAGNAIFINAMTPETFAKKHVLGSFNLPNNGPEDRERISKMRLPFPKDKEILVYCGWTGESTSAEVALILISRGYTRVYVVRGGDGAMMAVGFPFVLEGKIYIKGK